MRRHLTVLAMTLLPTLAGCGENLEHWVEVEGQKYAVELAIDEPARQRGLMHRDSLPEQQGMLFVFADEQPRAFWMKNTLIALDIIYADKDGHVVQVLRDVPPCRSASCPSYPSRAPAKFTLELNAGESERSGIKTGSTLVLSPDIPRTGAQ